MKLALVGGDNERVPEFVCGALAFANELELQKLWLMDTDEARAKVVVLLHEKIVAQAENPFTLMHPTDLDEGDCKIVPR